MKRKYIFGLITFSSLFVIMACAAFNYRWYNVRVDGLGANEEERLRVLNRIVLKTPNQKLYPSLSGIQLNHAPNQHSPFCTLKCGDLKAAAQEMAGLEADLNHCREELEGR